MSYEAGMAAFNLEAPDLVPRTEYSVHAHWDLVKAVTGIAVTPESPIQDQLRASAAFRKAWDYGYNWNVVIKMEDLDKCRTKLGHANFAAGNVDFDDEVVCPFEDPEDAFDFMPMETYGQADHSAIVKRFNDDYNMKCSLNPDMVNSTGIYITLVSGLIEIFGWDIMLMALGIDAAEFGKVANRYADWVSHYFRALADSDVPVVTIHDDIVWTSGAFTNPAWYREFVFPNYKKLFAPLYEAGKKVIYTSDGNFTEFIDDIAATGVHGFVMEPTTDMDYIAEKYGKTHSFVGNADTRVLLSGTKEDIYAEVKRCMDSAKKCPGFFMAVGNHIPANTPVDNALWYNQAFEEMRRR